VRVVCECAVLRDASNESLSYWATGLLSACACACVCACACACACACVCDLLRAVSSDQP
jgi:hypothetical protein